MAEKTAPTNNRTRLGGMWVKENEYGKFYTGLITKADLDKLDVDDKGNIRIVVYKAKEQKSEASPALNIFGFLKAGSAPKPAAKSAAEPKADGEVAEEPAPDPTDLF